MFVIQFSDNTRMIVENQPGVGEQNDGILITDANVLGYCQDNKLKIKWIKEFGPSLMVFNNGNIQQDYGALTWNETKALKSWDWSEIEYSA